MALSPVNPWKPLKIKGNSTLYVIPQDGVYYPENTDDAADLSKVEEDKWRNVAAINSVSYQQETEDDEEEYFDAVTHTRVKNKNTQITLRSYELELTRYTLVYEAMMHGVPNPLSEETLAKMSADSEEPLPIFASTDPNIPVGVKMELWDAQQNHYLTRFFYANLKADGELALDGKILRPKVTLEVQASPHNKQLNTVAFTGQTEEE